MPHVMPAVELVDLIWILNPEDSELVQKVRTRARMSPLSGISVDRSRHDARQARSVLQSV